MKSVEALIRVWEKAGCDKEHEINSNISSTFFNVLYTMLS